MDFLIQRFIANAPNESSGAWIDVEVIRDLGADRAEQAAQDSGAEGRLRVSRWDMTEEYTSEPGPPVVSRAVKSEST